MFDFPIDPQALASEIEIPLENWPLNCHGIAEAILQNVPVKGMRLARGHYHGYVSRNSKYRGGVTQHSWLVAEDGRIVDPTRWAMESPDKPRIYIGENDVYDEAGLQLISRIPPMLPQPGPSQHAKLLSRLPLEKVNRIALALGHKGVDSTDINDRGLNLLADQYLKSGVAYPPGYHDDPVELYSALADAGLKAMIKIDLWNLVMEPEKLMRQGDSNRWFSLPEPEEITDARLFFKLCNRFISIEERECTLERELEELGYTIDELHDALNELDGFLRFLPEARFEDIPRSMLNDLVVISGDILGSGMGVGLQVERYAASLGFNRKELDRVLRAAGDWVGYTNWWI